MRPLLKRGLHWAGSGLAIVGIVFIAIRLLSYGDEMDFSRLGIKEWSAVAGLALIYGLANMILAFAWRNLLMQNCISTSRRWVIRTYGISQISKYIPGNFFHLAGRQAMGMADGVASWPLAKSTVCELGLITVAGGLFGLLTLPLVIPGLPTGIAPIVFFSIIGIVAGLLWHLIGPPVARAFGYYAVFLAVSGLLFIGLIALLVEGPGDSSMPWLPLGGAYVLAWLAGLVTPGAPAGVGVRELVLLFLLKGLVSEADLLLAVMLGRMMTVVGDLGFFGISSMLKKKKDDLPVNFRITRIN